MRKTIIKVLAIAAAVPSVLTGCIKEAVPTDVATQPQVTLETLVRGIPAALVQVGSAGYASAGQAWDFGLPAIHIASESMTGDLVVTGNTGYDWFAQFGSNTALGSEYAVATLTWNTYYSWIKMANDVIRQISGRDINELTSTEKAYLGFAYAYRAMFYFDLVRLYEPKPVTDPNTTYRVPENILGLGVPVVLPETTEEQAKNNPRARVDDIYNNLIFPDLNQAEELLTGFSATDKYTISLAFVYGMKARAYLERGTAGEDAGDDSAASEAYAKAAEYARMAITASGCTPLTQTQWEDPSNGFNSAASNNAWIWGLAIPAESVSNLLGFTAHMSTENAWSAYGNDVGRAINRNLYNSINRYDFRKHSWLDPDRGFYDYKSCRPDGSTYFRQTLKDYANIKFRPAGGNYQDPIAGGAADHCMMRVEEMYFIEAEAAAHSNLSEGARLLNDFMNNWRMTDGVKYDCSSRATTIESFTNELMLQKRIEFWGEGIVMFDMKRLNMSTRRGYVGTNAPASYRLNTEGRAPWWNFVISRGETQNNPAVANQNNPDPSDCIKAWN